MVMKDVTQSMLDNTEFNMEMVDRQKAKQILKIYEAGKLEVLSMLSDPYKNHFKEKDLFVLKLATEQAKIEDQIWKDHKVDFNLFLKACHFYGMMKTGSTNDLARDAEVIKHNLPQRQFK